MGLTMDDITEMIKLISATYPYAFKDIETLEDRKRVKDLWFALFKDYPRELVIKGFHEALKVEKVNIVPASIIEQIEKIRSAFRKSEQELWAEFKRTLARIDSLAYKLQFNAIEENGKTKRENTWEEINKIYNNLSLELQRYCGSVNGLIDLSQISDNDLELYEKGRFMKSIEKIGESIKIQIENPQFAELAQGTLKALE